MQHKTLFTLVTILASLQISSCSKDDNNNFVGSLDAAAIINTVASDYSDSDIELVNIEHGIDTGKLTAKSGNYANGLSDYSVAAYGENFYRIGRYGIDTITKYSITNPDTPVYTYSTLDNSEDPTSNPYQLVFLSETKAYLIRYNSPFIWIVNPSAATENDFKIDEIDMSDYNEPSTGSADGSPEISDGVIVDGKLFLTLQRQDNFTIVNSNAYVVVIDTATDTEIDTDNLDAPTELFGIQLQTNNPERITYQADAGLYVQSVGAYESWDGSIPADYKGGIEKVFLDDYSTDLIVDDGDALSHPYGQIAGLVIVSDTLGYFIGYAGWGDNSLHEFNPSTGQVYWRNVAGLGDDAYPDDIPSINLGPQNSLWVSLADLANPRVLVIDTANNEIIDEVETQFNPAGVVFAEL